MYKRQDVNKIHPEYVMSEIDKLSSDDAVFTVDTGMTCVWAVSYTHLDVYKRQLPTNR